MNESKRLKNASNHRADYLQNKYQLSALRCEPSESFQGRYLRLAIRRDMKTIQLQSIGRKNAIPAKELKVGDVMIWNFGGREKVTKIIPSKTGKSLTIDIKYDSMFGGEVNGKRRLNIDTLVATEKLNPGTRRRL